MGFSHELDLPETNGVFQFAGFELNPHRGTLMRNGEEIPLRRQCFSVLIYLIQHRGVLVTKQELMDAVWPDVVVTDASVPQCICTIRRALGDDSKTLIRSMPRNGYLFDTPVSQEVISTNGKVASRQRFQFSGFPGNTSAFLITLAAAIILLFGLWSTSDDNLEKPQTVVTSSVFPDSGLEKLHDKLVEYIHNSETPVAIENTGHEAIKHFELGNFFFGRRAPGDLLRAIGQFRSAVSSDPDFADAWVGLAGALKVESKIEGSWLPGKYQEYVNALQRALELDPNNPDANVRIASYYRGQGNRQLARQYFDRALEFGSDNALVLAYSAGLALEELRYEDAVSMQRRAVTLEPLSYVYQINLAHFLKFAGKLDEAIAVYQTTLDLTNGNEEDAIEGLFRCYLLQGRYEQAEAYASQLSPGAARYQSFALLSIARNQEQRSQEMLDRLFELPGTVAALRLAEVYAYAGDAGNAFRWLGKALDEPFATVPNSNSYLEIRYIRYSELLRPIIADDRWLAWQNWVEEQNENEG